MAEDFDKIFNAFASFGVKDQKEVAIGLKNIDKWIKQAGLSKKLTTTDTGITFSKIAKSDKVLSPEKFKAFIADLCASKKLDNEDILSKLEGAGIPGLSNVTQAASGAAAAAMERLTDTSAYTGSHKERFDESGHGKGLEGRTDVTANDGYVQGYKDKDSYDKANKTGEDEEEEKKK